MNTLIPALTPLLAFASALVFDRAIRTIRVHGPDTALIGPQLWAGVLLELGFVALLFASSWLIAVKFRPPRWLAVILTILELVVIFALPLATAGIPYLSPFIRHGIRALFSAGASDGAPGTSLSLQGCAILLSAVYSLFAPTRTHAA